MHSDASKVSVSGNGIKKAFRNQKAQFTVDTRNAGKKNSNLKFLCVLSFLQKLNPI